MTTKTIQINKGICHLAKRDDGTATCMACKKTIPAGTWHVRSLKYFHIDCFLKHAEDLYGKISNAMLKATAEEI